MKKYLFAITLFIIWEKNFSQTFSWKPTVGVNASLQNVSNTGKNKIKAGYDVGLLIEAPLKENLSIEMGLLYVQNNSLLQRTFIYPFEVSITEPTQIVETFYLNLFKAPLLLVLSQTKSNPLSFGIGAVVKYNFSSHREGFVVDYPDQSYSSNFTIDTQSESKIGFGIQAMIRKNFSINKSKFSAGIYYDVDLSKWRYPTNFELEKKTYYSLRSHNLSMLFSYIL